MVKREMAGRALVWFGAIWLFAGVLGIYADQSSLSGCLHPTEPSYYGEVNWSWWPPSPFCSWDNGFVGEPQYFWALLYVLAVVPALAIIAFGLYLQCAGNPVPKVPN